MRISIDDQRCTGHGRCYMLAPALFRSDRVGHGEVVADEVGRELEAEARKAVANCPEEAIMVSE